MLSLQEAEALISVAGKPLPAEERSLASALGCVLAADVQARLTQPQWPQVAMDGYAVALDAGKPNAWPIQKGIAPAGTPRQTLESGKALRVTTGSPLPENADTVVMQEDTREVDGCIELTDTVSKGANIRPSGQDFGNGDVIAHKGQRVGSGLIATLRHAGVHAVSVHPKPRLAVIVTGSELIADTRAATDAMTPDTNGPFLQAWASEHGFSCSLHHCDESPQTLADLIGTLKGTFDALVICGGASVGPRDGSHAGLASAGANCVFSKVAQKPGKPMALYALESTPVLLLPGNPAAVFCGTWWHLHRIMQGLEGLQTKAKLSFILANDPPRVGGRSLLVRAQVSLDNHGRAVAKVLPGQLSHLLGNLGNCNAILQLDPGVEATAGSPVSGMLLD